MLPLFAPSALNYGNPFVQESVARVPNDGNPNLAMLGVRDVSVVTPTSFHHHLHHHSAEPLNAGETPGHLTNPATALGVGVGVNVIPLLTATPCFASQSGIGIPDESERSIYIPSGSRNRGSGSGGIQLWQNPHHYLHQQPPPNQPPLTHHQIPHSYFKNSSAVTTPSLLDPNSNSGLICGGDSGEAPSRVVTAACISNSGGATATCQDCGNQAKKDCSYRRCRTCCKSRGFDCATHVKSTWIPASRRRERQLMATTSVAGGGVTAALSSDSTSGAKKPRLVTSQTTASHTSTSNTTPPWSLDTSSSRQAASFRDTLPGQVRAPAMFKCVKVTAVEGGEDEYAYEAMVKIGGHIFKGFLYDQGSEGRDSFLNLSELHLGGGSDRRNTNGASTSSPNLLDTADAYAAVSGVIR